MPERWDVAAAERIREQAASKDRQASKIIVATTVFDGTVRVEGDLNIVSPD